jgi:tetratricopeptide (TPR) repeat protein
MLFVYHQTRGEHLEAGRICLQLLESGPTKQLAMDSFEIVGKILENLGAAGPLQDESLEVCRNVFEGLTRVAPTFVEAKCEFVKLILFRLPPTPERTAQAVDLARAAIAIESAPELHDLLAFALYRQGKLDEALATLEEALQLYPDDPKLAGRMERLREAGAGKR